MNLESVRDSVKYCCFLLEAEVTDSALLALSKEILTEKVQRVSNLSTQVEYLTSPYVGYGITDGYGCFIRVCIDRVRYLSERSESFCKRLRQMLRSAKH